MPHVLDADALNAVAEAGGIAPRADRIWTPHPGEFRRLTGTMPRGDEDRARAASRFAETAGGVLVLKGHRTIVVDRERIYTNLGGNPGMATGGSGDVLTGVIAALLARGVAPFAAAVLGVYLHGLAGDLAARTLGEDGLVAGDIASSLPSALRRHRSMGSDGR